MNSEFYWNMPKSMASYILGIPLYFYNSFLYLKRLPTWFRLPTSLGNSQRSNITPSFYYLRSKMYFVTATGGWIQRIQILQSSVSSPSFTSVLKPGPRCADDQMDLWCNLCKPFAPCELENQRQDFRMALEQRLSSLCYLIANFHGLFSLTCSTFSSTFSAGNSLAKRTCSGCAGLSCSGTVITPRQPNTTFLVDVVLSVLQTCSHVIRIIYL